MFFVVSVFPDVWFPQAKDVPQSERMLHLQGEVLQLSLHWQQTLRERLPELLWVIFHSSYNQSVISLAWSVCFHRLHHMNFNWNANWLLGWTTHPTYLQFTKLYKLCLYEDLVKLNWNLRFAIDRSVIVALGKAGQMHGYTLWSDVPAASVKHVLEKSVMHVCCWWNAGRSFRSDPKRTGIM